MWRRLSGEELPNIFETIEQDIIKYTNDFELKFYTGCDSQVHNDKVRYITAIVLYRQGKGGLVYYNKDITDYNNIPPKKRLWNEVIKAVDISMKLDNDLLIEHGLCVEEVHTDLNYDKKYLSSEIVNQCLGYIKSMGFHGYCKPLSWASSKVADRVTKRFKDPRKTRYKAMNPKSRKKHKQNKKNNKA